VGELIDPELSSDLMMRIEMMWRGTTGRRILCYFAINNRLADEEAAFNLLHLLHHLNGAASDSIPVHLVPISRLNPAIIRHYQSHGGDYRLHFRGLDARDSFTGLYNGLQPLLPTGARRCNGGSSSGDTRFIRIGRLRFHSQRPEDMPRVKEIITNLGVYCRKMELSVSEYTNQQFNELLEVSYGELIGPTHQHSSIYSS
jgi:hypothetical protein